MIDLFAVLLGMDMRIDYAMTSNGIVKSAYANALALFVEF